MDNHQDARFDKLEALIEKGFADVRADLKDTHRRNYPPLSEGSPQFGIV
jgi:hypothetical protein